MGAIGGNWGQCPFAHSHKLGAIGAPPYRGALLPLVPDLLKTFGG